MAMSAENRSNLQPFSDNSNVSTWVKILEFDEKPKKKNKFLNNCIYVKHKVIYTISEVNLIFPDLNNF